MNSETVRNCPKCQAVIPSEAPQGLCPTCLLAAASIPTDGGSHPDSVTTPDLGTVAATFPQLEILGFIGQGGMGFVYKARQPKLDRVVALKLLPQKPGADPSFCERFNREARVLARLNHPNIVAVHDFGEAGPFFYLLMEFVDGVNLRQALRAGRFSPAQALSLVPRICDALQYAHEEGVLHRDIKPENLLLDTRGRVKIADFGIAKLLGETKDITLTARGGAIGTPHYMAPEQLERPHDVDQRADVYSLGVVFYEMLTGELPIGRFAPPSEKASIDPRVDEVVLRTLEKERERRFPSAGEVKTHVEKITATPSGFRPQPGTLSNAPSSEDVQAPPVIAGHSQEKAEHNESIPKRWSWRALIAGALVGLSFILLVPAFAVGMRIGPNDLAPICLLVGIPALAGTLLAWVALRKLKIGPARRGGRLALLAAVAWPLAGLSCLMVLNLVLSEVSMQSHLFHMHSKGLAFVALVGGILSALALDVFLVRRWLRLWRVTRTLPHEELRALLRRAPRRVLWPSIAGLTLLALIFLFRPRQSMPAPEPTQGAVLQIPNVPSGYEVGAGEFPGNDDRVFRSNLNVPPGYTLTLAPILLSNQVPIRPLVPNAGAMLVVPQDQPVHAQLTWRLLGGTTLADGAPLQFTLSLIEPQHGERSFHLVTPEPVVIDWVTEPAQLWPPQSGHTRFVLMKGASSTSSAELSFGTEWAVAIEARLDPIPESFANKPSLPQILAVSDWTIQTDSGAKLDTMLSGRSGDAPAEAALWDMKIARYVEACTAIDRLAEREKELLRQFTPENTWVKTVRDELAAQQGLKRQLEGEIPSLTRIHKSPVLGDLPGVQR